MTSVIYISLWVLVSLIGQVNMVQVIEKINEYGNIVVIEKMNYY